MIRDDKTTSSVLPRCASDYIELVAKKVRYRRKVRTDVRQELEGHFEDALRGVVDEQQRIEKAMALIKEFGDPGTLATLIRRGKKRCRPIWLKAIIRTVQAAGIAILALVVYIGWMFTGRPYISVDYVAELNKMVQPTVDESLNAEPYYKRAASLLTPEPNDLPNPWSGEPTREQISIAREWVARNALAFEEIHRGNERPYAWRNYTSEDGTLLGVLLPGLSERRKVARAIGWKAWLNGQDGRFGEAFDGVKQCYLLGQHMEGGTILIEKLVAVALEAQAVAVGRTIITMPDVKVDSLARFQDEFESLVARSDFRMPYDGEHMFMEDTVQRTFTKSGRVAPLAMGRFAHRVGGSSGRDKELSAHDTLGAIAVGTYSALTQPDRETTLRQTAEYYVTVQQFSERTPYEAKGVRPTLSEVTNRLIASNILFSMMLPALEKTIAVSWRNQADCHAFAAQIALERYKREKGAYPESLAELQATGYLKELPMDPWSDGPLVYRRTDDGYTLYSVGANFVDDGGKSVNSDGKPVSAPNLNALDIVFWPVAK